MLTTQIFEDNNNHSGKSGEAAPEEQGGFFAPRHKIHQSKVFHHSKGCIDKQMLFQIISETGKFTSKLLVKYSYQVSIFPLRFLSKIGLESELKLPEAK